MIRGCGMKKNNVNQKKGAAHAGIGKIVLWIVLLLVAVIQIFPLIWLLDFSLASSTEMFTNGLLILPEKIQWGNYVTAFVDGHFLQYLKNSIIINGLAVFFVLLISIMAAYACRRMRWKLSGLVKTILLLGMMIPIHATLLPNYKIYNTLGLTDTIWALLIPYVAFSLPQGLFLMTGFIDSIPWEMEEAAVMDGCGIYRIVFQIITPMLKPSIATVAIMTFLNNWNEFIMASTYLSTPKWKTLPFSVLDASTPEGAKAYYNAAIDTKEDDYRKAEELRAQMLGKISEYERQLRDLQKKCMQDSLKTQQFIDQGNDDAAMTYLKSQQDTEKDIEVIKNAIKELKDNEIRQGEVVSELKEACEKLKKERDNAILTLETAQTTKSLQATNLSDRTEDKMLEKVRDGVRKTKEQADGVRISYDHSAEVQKKRLDKQVEEAELQAKLQEMKRRKK